MSAPTPTDDDFLDPAQWMSPKDLAGVMGINLQSLYNKISVGEDLPVSYPVTDRKTRFFKPDVKAWLLKRRRVPAAVQVAELESAKAGGFPKPWDRSATA
ncbi:MAG: hypothetical protein V9E93_16560 [Steroidobacteraceae bacterium]